MRNQSICAAAQELYKGVFGVSPNDVIALKDDMVLLETSEATLSEDRCPSGYREVLMRRQNDDWAVYAVAEPGRHATALEQRAAMLQARAARRVPVLA